ncbi:class IV lanthionine synthetase LanL [Allonocardiopsis opalescens]|uniref:non-specific serine/threonine protein kinase n=1 Tax=Allonocardiopsis opalescens TaxID=1144618 RepID=A0A2T0QA14_9ACTN|nr:class IV lanthionine synthetase LanL [Allonocardiopsis opalescens]PRY00718.1 serine/threonine protein kinase [Allonocardiopsis opalescens]
MADGTVLALVRERAREYGRVVTDRGRWAEVLAPGLDLPPQGWKIHISARPSTLGATVERVLPLLLEAPCRFEFARDVQAMVEINSSRSGIGGVGKAVTVYPDPEHFAGLAGKLAAELVGLEGPRVDGDRRVRPDAPVYYRYAPFRPGYAAGAAGDFESVVRGPDGRPHPAAPTAGYHPPTWSPDPLTGALPPPPGPDGDARQGPAELLLGGRYAVPSALQRRATGGVYRGTDQVTGAAVVVKEARAHTEEDRSGRRDARTRLREERRVLEALAGLDGVPQVLDHFRHGPDEFLVTTDAGPCDLRVDVIERGPYTTAERDLAGLAARLLAVVDAVHGRGVVIGDLAPKNVVVGDGGRLTLVDFELGHGAGQRFHGWTPGYSSPAQERGEPTGVADDYYSLGATLFYAATGMAPLTRPTRRVPDDGRMAATLRAQHPGPHPVRDLIPELVADDPARRCAAVRALRERRPAVPAPRGAPRYTVAAGSVPALLHGALEQAHTAARALLEGGDRGPAGFPSPVNLYRGGAGIGMELLRHGDPASRRLAEALAYWAAGFLTLAEAPPGLWTGQAGAAVFLAAAARALEPPGLDRSVRALARSAPEAAPGADLAGGAAGIGLGQLLLWHHTGDGTRLGLAARCARRLVEAAPGEEGAGPDGEPPPGRALGLAHGLAGAAHVLALYQRAAAAHPDAVAADGPEAEPLDAAVDARFAALADRLPELLDAAARPAARPAAASLCQGLAGIGTVLLRAPGPRAEEYRRLAAAAADACHAHAPRMPGTSQCCGLAGIGELLLDVAEHTGDGAYRDRARDVAGLMLTRSDGTPRAPVFLDQTRRPGGGWATGATGVLAFLRRLDRPGEPRQWLGDELRAALPAPARGAVPAPRAAALEGARGGASGG